MEEGDAGAPDEDGELVDGDIDWVEVPGMVEHLIKESIAAIAVGER